MFQTEQLQEKWKPLLEYDGLDEIKDPHVRGGASTFRLGVLIGTS